MGFGPRESPNPGLLPPRGDKASTTVASSAGSLYSTSEWVGTSNSRNSSSKNSLSLSTSHATKSRELGSSHQQEAPLDGTANRKSEAQLRHSGSLSTTGVLAAEMSSTIRGTFRATKSQGLFPSHDLDRTSAANDAHLTTQESLHGSKPPKLSLKQQDPSSKPSDMDYKSASLSITGGSCASTIKGTFRATKSQGLCCKPNDLEKTSSGTRLSCSQSLGGTATSATGRGTSGRERDILSGTAKSTTDTGDLSLSNKGNSTGMLKSVTDIAAASSSRRKAAAPL